MASIDDRIVNMDFRGPGFMSGAQQAVSMLDRLKASLNNLRGAEAGINNLDAAGKRLNLSGIASGVENISKHFSAMGIIGMATLASIANRAVGAGISMVKSLTITPVLAGLSEYETKLNAIQTILSNTAMSGTTLNQVTTALNELNKYADLTIYDFAEMTRNIGTFTAAGVDLKTSVASIKGIANLAAMSGSSAQQASTAMYQLSQAIATGTVKLIDWNSVVNAGMGGKTFQNALIQTAKVHGVAVDAMIKKSGSFRNSLQEGWLTSQVLTETLSQFTGDLSAAQLKSMGYTDAQTQAIMKQAKMAVDSATKIRTMTQLQSALRESIASSWAGVWETLIGNFEQAPKTLTGIYNILNKMFTGPVNNLNEFLKAFDKLGGKFSVVQGIKNIFQAVGLVLRPIRDAFRDIFPPATVETIALMANKFQLFTEKLKISGTTAMNIHRIFEGFFSIVKIGVDIIKGFGSVIAAVFRALTGGSGSFLELAARLGDFVTHIRESIEAGGKLTAFFNLLGKILSYPVKLLHLAGSALLMLATSAAKVMQSLGPVISKIADAFRGIGRAIGNAIQTGDMSNVLDVINKVLLGGVLGMMIKFFRGLGKRKDFKSGLLDAVTGPLKALTGTLTAMQTNLKAGTLLKIAAAVAILAASVTLISMVNAGNLAKSLSAMTVMFTELLTAMAVVSKIGGLTGIVTMPVIAAALNLLATSILILSGAVAILAQFSWAQLAKGIGAIAAMLAILVTATSLMSGNAKGVVVSAYAMEVMAAAMNVMSIAVINLGRTDFKTLAKGVGTIAALLVIMGTFNKFGGKQLIGTAASILILGAALNVMALAIRGIGSLPLGTMVKGLAGIAGGLVIIAVGMRLMPPNMLLTAAGLLVVSAAMVILSKALKTMGGMSWTEIAKSLIELAGALVIIAAAMIVMTGALAGAAALVVISAALAILTPVLIALGSMSWQQIATGLIALAAAFAVIGLAGLLLGPIIPFIIGVAAAVGILGVGLLAAGAGIFLFGTGLGILAAALTASGAAILRFVTDVLNLIPLAMKKFGEGVILFAQAIAKGGPALIGAFTAILTAMLQAMINVIPKLQVALGRLLDMILNLITTYTPRAATTFMNLLFAILQTVSNNIPRFVAAGADIVVKFLNGIASNLGRVITAGTNIVIAWIQGIGSNAVRIANAAFRAVIDFINGLTGAINANAGALRSAGWGLAMAIADGVTGGLVSKAGEVAASAINMVKGALGAAWNAIKGGSPSKEFMKVGFSIAQGVDVGIGQGTPAIVDTIEKTASTVFSALSEMASRIESGDIQPTITPVIDLTAIRKGFSELSAMSLKAASSAAVAASISAANAPSAREAGLISAAGGTTFTYTQYNTSPKPLSAAEIYRQTKNQLSVVRGALP
jgi:tape measure domain-containing protein